VTNPSLYARGSDLKANRECKNLRKNAVLCAFCVEETLSVDRDYWDKAVFIFNAEHLARGLPRSIVGGAKKWSPASRLFSAEDFLSPERRGDAEISAEESTQTAIEIAVGQNPDQGKLKLAPLNATRVPEVSP
jgi:hypothetical protein